jgi:hypothetical protein
MRRGGRFAEAVARVDWEAVPVDGEPLQATGWALGDGICKGPAWGADAQTFRHFYFVMEGLQ